MANPHGLKVGQKVFIVLSQRRRGADPGSWYSVEKIGRKWADLSPAYRIDMETMRLDGGAYSSPGRGYLSEEDFFTETLRSAVWAELRRSLQYLSVPDHLSLADIEDFQRKVDGTSPMKSRISSCGPMAANTAITTTAAAGPAPRS